jgi:LmbE family N-acetylglucosaminyl deacetylase
VSASRLTILHLAPHPDDESIGAPATLLELQANGHHVINYPCSFGREEQVETRRAEVEEACRRAGFELDHGARGFPLSSGDDLAAAQRRHTEEVRERIVGRQVDVLVAPSPHDGHHGHEVVGRAACAAIEACGDRTPRLWLWGLWADLPWPTLYVGFDESRLDEVVHVLEAHASQLARNDYRQVVRGRALANRALGAERIFGYGSATRGQHPLAEVLTEAVLRNGRWLANPARELDPRAPLADAPPPRPRDDPARARPHPLGWWLGQESFGDRMRRESAVMPPGGAPLTGRRT